MIYILGIDIGTSNTKAVGYTVEGTVVCHANVAYSFSSKREGYHEIDPEKLFEAVLKVIEDAVNMAGHQPAAVSFSSAMHGIMAVDQQCRPLTNMITWADLRSNDYAQQLKGTELGRKLYQRTGTPIHPMSPLCKLMWMKDNLPGIFSSAYKFISIKEYVFFHLFGDFVVDHSIASATGLYDIFDLDWNADALSAAGITKEKLSSHVPTSHVFREMKNGRFSQLGIDAATPFIIGGSDGCLAHLGSNALKQGDVSLTIGTSGAVRMMMTKPVYDSRGRIFNYLLSDHLYVAGGPVNNGGNLLQWFNKNMAGRHSNAEEDYNWFIAEAMKITPGAGGLVFLPYIYGERAPVWDAEARGVFFGINGTHTQAHFMRAILEGISFALQEILETLEQVIGPANNIYVSGGFIHSPAWVQLLADVLGKKLIVMSSADASAAGAAIIGMKAIGMMNSFEDAASFFEVKEMFEPDMVSHNLYGANYSVYGQLYDAFKSLKK